MADAALTEDRRQQAAASFTQERRLLAIDTPLGKDKLLLTRLAGEEEISKPYTFRITMFSEDQEIAPESLIGRKVTMWVRNYHAGEVPISGMVRSLSAASVDARGLRGYH